MSDKTGLFIGLCGLDIAYYASEPLPISNTKQKVKDFSIAVGGPAANAAITYASLTGNSTLVTIIGNSDVGILVKNMLKSHNVNVIDLGENLNQSCNISSIHINGNNGDRTILSGQQSFQIGQFEIPESLVENCSFLLYDGNLYGIIAGDPLGIEKEIVRVVKNNGPELVLDAGSHKDGFATCFTDKTTVISSENYRNSDGLDIFDLNKIYELKHCAITRGANNILYEDAGKIKEIQVFPRNAVDTLAAGDVFHGAYCYFQYHEGMGFVESLKMASEFAGHFVECQGVQAGLEYAKRF